MKRWGRDVISTKYLKINVCCKYSVFSNFILVVWKHRHPSTAYMYEHITHNTHFCSSFTYIRCNSQQEISIMYSIMATNTHTCTHLSKLLWYQSCQRQLWILINTSYMCVNCWVNICILTNSLYSVSQHVVYINNDFQKLFHISLVYFVSSANICGRRKKGNDTYIWTDVLESVFAFRMKRILVQGEGAGYSFDFKILYKFGL